MAITKDATKGWARPANASEWTELLSGTGIANPDHSWDCTEASGNLSDDIGSLTLTANSTPIYAQAASGWAGTGLSGDAGTGDRFAAAAGVGPDPDATSQTWLIVFNKSANPSANRAVFGINSVNSVNAYRMLFTTTGVARASFNATNVDGSVHASDDYVAVLRYDRSASVAAVYTDLDTLTSTYSATDLTDGAKGIGSAGYCEGITFFLVAMWEGANAETLDATDIATIRGQIENPPSGVSEDDTPYSPRPRTMAWIPPPPTFQRGGDELPIVPASIAIEDPAYRPRWSQPITQNVRAPWGWADPDILGVVAANPDAPGPTLAGMQAGNVNAKWVCAIEGYGNMLTDGDTTAVTVAWSGTGYDTAIGGLFVRPSHEQSIDPWNPFANGGGSLTLQVVTDSFGVDTHLKTGGSESFVTASLDCDDNTSITVGSAAGFTASGTAYIGTEAISYTSKTGTTLVGLTRGRYSPFLTQSNNLFAHPHTITVDDPTAVSIPPVVSSTPRSWLGKWVGLWRHLKGSTGLLNIKADALCTFAGRITEIRDNPTTMTTDVEVTHALDYVRDAVLGENPWKAEIDDGIFLAVDQQFDMTDWETASVIGAGARVASPLIVVSGVPANDYEMEAGRRPIVQVMGDINRWLDQALTDGDLFGRYFVKHGTAADGTTHGRLGWYMTTGSGGTAQGRFELKMPSTVHRMLGGFAGAVGPEFGTKVITRDVIASATQQSELSVGVALRSIGEAVALSDEFGEFFDQSTSLPDNLLEIVPLANNGVGLGEIGLVMLNDTQPVIVVKDGASLLSATAFDPATGTPTPGAFDVPWDQAGDLKLRQVYVIQGTLATVLKTIWCSTGTAGFNHATYDTLPAILGLGIPYELLGADFFLSIDRLAHADQQISIIIDKPKKLVDIIGAALKLRFAFLRWKSGGLEFFSWMTPTTGDALEESNKASPAGNADEQRSVSVLSDRWARNVIKVDYDKDFSLADTGDAKFNSHLTIIDRAAIDDAGGQKKTETIPDPTSFTSSFIGGSGSLDAVLAHFRSIATMFTRPVRTSRRTIAPTMFEGLSVGDAVIVTDVFARDPDTGERGVSTRPGIIVAHSYEPGGFDPSGSIGDMHGEVEVMFLDLLRVGPYVPCADVSSYNAGTSTITCGAHDCSTTGEAVDASWMPAGHSIRIVQRDPATSSAPLSWDRIVQSVSGNDIVLTAALSSPTYDAALFYRVIWDDYPDAVAGQQVYSYQADDADYLISDTRAPYQYTVGTQLKDTEIGDANAASDPVELPPDSSYGDGVGYDVGHMQALNRLANNLYDYKTAISTPVLFQTAIAVSKHPNDEWELAMVMPIFVGADGLTSAVRRKLYVAPMLKSSDGNTVNARITLSKNPPTGDSELDVTFASPSTSVTFTTTSTTYVTAATQGINLGPLKDVFGIVYLTLEIQAVVITTTASCRGIATAYQGTRE